MIFKGTTIGDNVIIGAGSLVGGVIPPNSVAAGNSCRSDRKNSLDVWI